VEVNLEALKKPKNIWGLLLVLEVVILGGFFYKVYLPRKNKIKALEEQISQEQMMLQKYRSRLKNFKKVKEEADSVEQLWNRLNEILPSEEEIPRWIKKVALMGIRNRLEFTMVKPMPSAVKGFYVVYPIDIDLIGSYHDFGRFVEELTNSPQVTRISNLEILAFNFKDLPEFTVKVHFQLQVFVFKGTSVRTLLGGEG